jgi:acyl carrier protein
METKTFLLKLQEALGEDELLTVDTKFEDLSLFDSMAIMMIIAFVDEHFRQTISSKQLNEMKTVGDLISIIGLHRFH